METKIEHKSIICPEVKATRDDQHLIVEGYEHGPQVKNIPIAV